MLSIFKMPLRQPLGGVSGWLMVYDNDLSWVPEDQTALALDTTIHEDRVLVSGRLELVVFEPYPTVDYQGDQFIAGFQMDGTPESVGYLEGAKAAFPLRLAAAGGSLIGVNNREREGLGSRWIQTVMEICEY